MNDPINRDAMRLAVQLYAARDMVEHGRARFQDDAVEDARELILAHRRLQRLANPSESQAIFQRLSQLMASYDIEVVFYADAVTQAPRIRLTSRFTGTPGPRPFNGFTVPL